MALDLGEVKNLDDVRNNSSRLRIVMRTPVRVDVTSARLLLLSHQHSHLNPARHYRWQTATNLRAPPIAELPVTKASVRERMTPGHAARHFVPHLPSGPLLRHNYGYRSDENCDLHHSTAVF